MSPSWSAWSQGATAAVRSVASRMIVSAGLPGCERDDVVGPDAEARDVDPAAVDEEVAVPDELPRLGARAREAEPVDDVVEPRLEHPQEVLARRAGAARRLLVRVAELLLEQPVVAARLLLLAQLQQVLALLDAAAAVLTRRIRAALDARTSRSGSARP